jgi:hypothetical protein
MTAVPLEPALLLSSLEADGFTLSAGAGGKLLVTPASRLDAGQRGDIARYKTDLLALLAEREASDREAVARPPPLAFMEVLTATPQGAVARVWGVPYQYRPLTRDRLERFWAETGWTPVGGWKPGDRIRPADEGPARRRSPGASGSATSDAPAAGGERLSAGRTTGTFGAGS